MRRRTLICVTFLVLSLGWLEAQGTLSSQVLRLLDRVNTWTAAQTFSSATCTGTCTGFGAGTGSVTTSGTPASGNLARFAGAAIVTNGNLSGDVTTTDTLVTTLANSGVSAATYGSATAIPVITFDAKGRATTATTAAAKFVQVVNTQTGAVATGTTQIPTDDTIPQNTEGNEYMTLAVTPTSGTNKLKIEVVIYLSPSGTGRTLTAALFQDTTANALAAGTARLELANAIAAISFSHYMTAGTTSATTFKVRAGASDTGTTTFNGSAGGRIFGGVMASSITISEIVP